MNVQNERAPNMMSAELTQQLLELRQRAVRAAEILDMHRRNGSFDDDYLRTYFLIEALDLQLSRLLRRAPDTSSSQPDDSAGRPAP